MLTVKSLSCGVLLRLETTVLDVEPSPPALLPISEGGAERRVRVSEHFCFKIVSLTNETLNG
jgi:hypothetical protein